METKTITMNTLEKELSSLYSKYDRYQVLKDWFEICAITLNNSSTIIHDEAWKENENKYINTINKYEKEEQQVLANAFSYLVIIMDQDVSNGVFKDWLGELYMRSCTASKEKAQHFTPYSVGKLMAEMTVDNKVKDLKENEIITFNDCCVGGGCLPIAYCDVLKEKGINYQQRSLITCNDNDERCFYMTYIQLSLIGAAARVEFKDTLLNKNLGKTWDTPLLKMQYLKFRDVLRNHLKEVA